MCIYMYMYAEIRLYLSVSETCVGEDYRHIISFIIILLL